MKYENGAGKALSSNFQPFLEELAELARKYGFDGVSVVAMTDEGYDMAALGSEDFYPLAKRLVEELRLSLEPPAGNG